MPPSYLSAHSTHSPLNQPGQHGVGLFLQHNHLPLWGRLTTKPKRQARHPLAHHPLPSGAVLTNCKLHEGFTVFGEGVKE